MTERIKLAFASLSRDSVRLPLQTVAAVLIAYLTMAHFGLPDLSWGAFSALFVVRASVEGTIGEAAARILGAFVGVALGVLAIAIVAITDLPLLLAIAAGVGLMAAVSLRWPSLSYGLVTVTVLTVLPAADMLGGAWDKTVAIMIGSLSGIVAAVAVMPLSAPRRAYYDLADSIESFAGVLRKCNATLTDCEAERRVAALLATEPACERARDMITQARSARLDLLAASRIPTDLLDHVDQLWRTLPLMDRASQTPLSSNVCSRMGSLFDEVADIVIDHIERLAAAIRSGDSAGLDRIPESVFDALNQEVRTAFREDALDAYELEAVEVGRWAWQVVAQQVNELTGHVMDKWPGDAAPAADGTPG